MRWGWSSAQSSMFEDMGWSLVKRSVWWRSSYTVYVYVWKMESVKLKVRHRDTVMILLLTMTIGDNIISEKLCNSEYCYSVWPEPGLDRQPQLFVSLLLNESPAEMSLCPSEARKLRPNMCPLDVLEREASLKTFGWKTMKQLCALPESEMWINSHPVCKTNSQTLPQCTSNPLLSQGISNEQLLIILCNACSKHNVFLEW